MFIFIFFLGVLVPDCVDNGLLTDDVVNQFQRLIQQQYPGLGGLQDCLLGGFVNGAWWSVEIAEGVQIVHVGDNHWVAVRWTCNQQGKNETHV